MNYQTIKRSLKIPGFFIVFFILFPDNLVAQGDLMVYPKRINFEGVKRTEQLSLSNTGADTARYVISIINMRMTENGSFETITEPDSGQTFADKFIRYFPRSVVLAPREAQAVKFQLINTNELKPGEYRSHLYLRSQAEAKPLGEENIRKDSSITVSLVPIFGISVPIIIRVGEPLLEIKIDKLSFLLEKDTLPVVQMDLLRNGNISFYGDISVDYISPKGKTIKLAALIGMALYTPNSKRHFRLELNKTNDVDFHTGALIVTCTERTAKGIKPAQRQIELH